MAKILLDDVVELVTPRRKHNSVKKKALAVATLATGVLSIAVTKKPKLAPLQQALAVLFAPSPLADALEATKE
jgi:hypothetical protein